MKDDYHKAVYREIAEATGYPPKEVERSIRFYWASIKAIMETASYYHGYLINVKGLFNFSFKARRSLNKIGLRWSQSKTREEADIWWAAGKKIIEKNEHLTQAHFDNAFDYPPPSKDLPTVEDILEALYKEHGKPERIFD